MRTPRLGHSGSAKRARPDLFCSSTHAAGADEDPKPEEGQTLIEMVIAMALLGGVITLFALSFVTGTGSTRNGQLRQVAVTLADSALDNARAVTPSSSLLSGSCVTNPSSQVDLSTSWCGTSGNPVADEAYQQSQTKTTLDNTVFTTTIYAGNCYLQSSGQSNLQCTTTSNAASMIRVIADITWTASYGSGCVNGCSYVTSSLISNAADPVLNTILPSPPTQVAPTPGNGQMTINWGASGSNGGSPIIGYDVYVGTSAGGESYTSPACTASSTATSCVVGSLTNGTTYYFTVEAVNGAGNSGPSNEESAVPSEPPAATTGAATSVSASGATLNGSVNDENNTSSTVTFCYSTSSSLSNCSGATSVGASPSTTTGSSATAETATLSSLAPNTEYYFQIEAVSTGGSYTSYGSVLNFTTSTEPPTAATATASSVTASGATLNGSVNDENNTSSTVTFCYSTSSSLSNCSGATSVGASPSTATGSSAITETAALSSLAPNTKYYFQIEASSTGGSYTSYGSVLNFTTSTVTPTAATAAASSVTASGATLNGSVNDENNTSSTVTFCYSTSSSLSNCSGATSVGASPSTATGSSATTETATLSSLAPNTKYYFQIKAVSTGGSYTSYGSVLNFTTTTEAPTAATTAASSITATGATLNGSVNDENNTSSTVTFCYSTSSSLSNCSGATSVGASPSTATGNSATAETAALSSLAPDTQYYFQIEASSTGASYTTYGSVLNFTTTAEAPTAATTAASSITATGATLNGSVNDENNTSSTVTFCYSTSSSLSNCSGATSVGASPSTATGNSATAETAALSSLAPDTQYYFQIEASSTGASYTTYGSVLNFTTSTEPPTAATAVATSITDAGATLNGTANAEDSSTTVTFCYSTSSSLSNCSGGTVTTETGSSSPLTGNTATGESASTGTLAPNTKYYFQIEATSTAGTAYGSVFNFTTIAAPSVTQEASVSSSSTNITTASFAMTTGTTYIITAMYNGTDASEPGVTFTIPGAPTVTQISYNSFGSQANCQTSGNNCDEWAWSFTANQNNATATVVLKGFTSNTETFADVLALGSGDSIVSGATNTGSGCDVSACSNKIDTAAADLAQSATPGDVSLQVIGSDNDMNTTGLTWSPATTELYQSSNNSNGGLGVYQSNAVTNETTNVSGFSGSDDDWGTIALEIMS